MMRSKPLFIADWVDAIFVHFRIAPAALEPLIPLELDCFEGDAFVSLVAFTQKNLCPTVGGALAVWLTTPLASHEFLNVRTYVRCGNTRGIYFLAEWVPNRLAALIGPRTYGLPYRLGKLEYRPRTRSVSDGISNLRFQVLPPANEPTFSPPGSLDHFFLERYSAFTHRRGVIRRFDVDHAPWPVQRVSATVTESTLLSRSGDWYRHAQLVAAHVSRGVHAVTISVPRRVRTNAFS